METFNYPYHLVQNEYPQGSTVKFGRGYRFAARPSGPPEIIAHLHFEQMFYFQDPVTFAARDDVEVQLNILHLEKFYARQENFQPFYYQHATRGLTIARFSKPLVMPKVLTQRPGDVGGRNGWRAHQTEPFDLELILQP